MTRKLTVLANSHFLYLLFQYNVSNQSHNVLGYLSHTYIGLHVYTHCSQIAQLYFSEIRQENEGKKTTHRNIRLRINLLMGTDNYSQGRHFRGAGCPPP